MQKVFLGPHSLLCTGCQTSVPKGHGTFLQCILYNTPDLNHMPMTNTFKGEIRDISAGFFRVYIYYIFYSLYTSLDKKKHWGTYRNVSLGF